MRPHPLLGDCFNAFPNLAKFCEMYALFSCRLGGSPRENRLSWFGHICRNPIDVVVRRSDMVIGNDSTRGRSDMVIGNDITRGRGRLNLTLDVVGKSDMFGLNLNQCLALNRANGVK